MMLGVPGLLLAFFSLEASRTQTQLSSSAFNSLPTANSSHENHATPITKTRVANQVLIGTDTPPEANELIGPTSTPNAYAVSIEDLVGWPTLSELPTHTGSKPKAFFVNFDGVGPEEIVISGTDESGLSYVKVYANLDNRWMQVFYEIEPIGIRYKGLHHEIVNLKDDGTKQLLTYYYDGTSHFVSFRVYQFQGLMFLDELPCTDCGDYGLSRIVIANQKPYIVGTNNFFSAIRWNGNSLEIKDIAAPIPANAHVISYWRVDLGKIGFEPKRIEVKIGDYVRFVNRLDPNLEGAGECTLQMFFFEGAEFVDLVESPDTIVATKVGVAKIGLSCLWEIQGVADTIEIVINQ